MKSLALVASFFFVVASTAKAEAPPKYPEFVFATIEQGRQVLTNRDDFIKRLSPFDRAARLKTEKPVSEAEFLGYIAANVLSFTAKETNLVGDAFQTIQSRVEKLKLDWPNSILLIKTTGKEEGNAAYTRENAIVMPKEKLATAQAEPMKRLLCHELFHILSRHNPALKHALNEVIGFKKCAELRMPESWVWITNPDGPVNDHYITVESNGKPATVIPILLASPRSYDRNKGGDFFDYLSFKLLVVELGAGGALNFDSEKPALLDVKNVKGYFEQIGENTGYIIHPEEILADNFVLLVNDAENMKSPGILEEMRHVFETFGK